MLITSGEHYGALIDTDFDYLTYLDELARNGLNLTRVFSGSFVGFSSAPIPGYADALTPPAASVLTPWARSVQPGAVDGRERYDLGSWDPDYFERLRSFVEAASVRGIVVELTLFSSYYNEGIWRASPLYPQNNVNGTENARWSDVYTLKHPKLLAAQDAMARALVRAVKPFDNVYFEIINEPYTAGSSSAGWERHMLATVRGAEGRGGHSIAVNVANFSGRAPNPGQGVGILNYHYAGPGVVAQNYVLNRVVADDETGLNGTAGDPYRQQAWQFVLAGGGVFDNLDRTFTPSSPVGLARVPRVADSGGGPVLRRQLGVLRRFIAGLPFESMRPSPATVQRGLPGGASATVLAESGRAYAIYVLGGGRARPVLALDPGRYSASWLDPVTGRVLRTSAFTQRRPEQALTFPGYSGEVALALRRVG